MKKTMAAFPRSSPNDNNGILHTPSEPINGSSGILHEESSPSSSKLRRKPAYRISGEPNEAAMAMRGPIGRTYCKAPSFTKVITSKTAHHSAYCCRLALPCKFCEEHNIQKHVTMTDSTGQRRWHMRFQARRSSNNYTISNGWREFSYDHGLETGDELVFTLLSSSHFLVAFAAFDGLGGTRAMHPIRDGDEYPWKINHSRLACLSWDTRHSKEGEENVSVTASPREENVSHEETLLQPSETRPIQGMEKATAFVQNVVSILFPKELNPRGENSQSLQVHSSEGRQPGGQKHSVQDKPTTTLLNKPRIALPIKPRVSLPSKLNPSEEKVERFCQCKKVMVSKHRPT